MQGFEREGEVHTRHVTGSPKAMTTIEAAIIGTTLSRGPKWSVHS
jgi:hypothetical protein